MMIQGVVVDKQKTCTATSCSFGDCGRRGEEEKVDLEGFMTATITVYQILWPSFAPN